MRTIKIEKEVTKEDVYVVVDTNEKVLEVEKILSSSNQMCLGCISGISNILVYDKMRDAWHKSLHAEDRQYEITVPQLAELLGVEYPLRKREEEKKLPTLEELIEEAKSKMSSIKTVCNMWNEPDVEITAYTIGTVYDNTEKGAIAAYVGQRVRELL